MTTPALQTCQPWIDSTISGVENYQLGDFYQAEKDFAQSLAFCREELAAVNYVADPSLAPVELQARLIQSLGNLSIAYFPFSRLAEARALLEEALSLTSSENHVLLRSGCLATLSRLFHENEKYDQAETLLLEAIALAEPLNAVYACELANNLIVLYLDVPEWRDRLEDAVDIFARLEDPELNIEQNVEIFQDVLAGCRRIGPYWDKPGAPNPESVAARLIFYRSAYTHKTLRDRRDDFLRILALHEESLAVSPAMVVHCQMRLAEIAFENGDYSEAMAMSKRALASIEQSYLRDHPAACVYLSKASPHLLVGGDSEGCLRLLAAAEELAARKCGETSLTFLCARIFKLSFQGFAGAMKAPLDEDIEAVERVVEVYADICLPGCSLIIHSLEMLSKKLLAANQFELAHLALDSALEQEPYSFRPAFIHYDLLLARSEIFAKEGLDDEVRRLVSECEFYVFNETTLGPEARVDWTNRLAMHCVEAGLTLEAERIARNGYAFTKALIPRQIALIAKAKQHLGLVLARCGKTREGLDFLNDQSDAIMARSQSTDNEEITEQLLNLDALVKEARQAILDHNIERALEVAEDVIARAVPIMPKSSSLLASACLIVVDQARLKNDGATISRIINMVADMPTAFEMPALLPTIYKCAGLAYAASRDVRAESMFEAAVRLSEEKSTQYPEVYDECLMAYSEFCALEKMAEKSLSLLKRVVELRKNTHGPDSPLYASALSSMALKLLLTDIALADEASLSAVNIFALSKNGNIVYHYMALTNRLLVARRLNYEDEVQVLLSRMKAIKGALEDIKAKKDQLSKDD